MMRGWFRAGGDADSPDHDDDPADEADATDGTERSGKNTMKSLRSGYAVANRAEPSAAELAALQWNLGDDDRQALRKKLAEEISALFGDAPSEHDEIE